MFLKQSEETDQNRKKIPVRLKGMGSGLCVILDPGDPIDELKRELGDLFRGLQKLAVNANVVIDTGDVEAEDGFFEEIGTYLEGKFGVGSVKKRERKQKERGVSSEDHFSIPGIWRQKGNEVLMLTGRVRSGQKIFSEHHLVILGDVNPGAEIMAGGDIVVMGTLLGTAIAGQSGNEEAIIIALDFRPTQIQIGGIVAAGIPLSGRKAIEYAHVESGAIIVEDYLRTNPFGRQPRPIVR